MNLDDLKKHLKAATAYEWRGETIYFRKLGAKVGMELFARIKALSGEWVSERQDQDKTFDFHVDVVALTLSDAEGNLLCDTDEGRETLRNVNFVELTELGTLALQHSGFGENAKKNSAQSKEQPTDSALNSETQTAPTPTTY